MKNQTGWVVLGTLVVLMGCSEQEITTSPVPEAPERSLNTVLGPVDVLSAKDLPDGTRRIVLHQALPGKEHLTRTLAVTSRLLETGFGHMEVRYRLQDNERTSVQIVQRVDPAHPHWLETTLEAGGDLLRWEVKEAGDRVAVHVVARSRGVTRDAYREIKPGDLKDENTVESLREAFLETYPDGPLRNGSELRLLQAVVTSEDWRKYLEPAGTMDPATERRLLTLCVGASAISKISCLAARLFPAAWAACVPSTGIALACLAYQIIRLSANEPDDCGCGCGCGAPGGDGTSP